MLSQKFSLPVGKIKFIPDFQGHGTTTFRYHTNLNRENIGSILCTFFGHDFKTEVVGIVRKENILFTSYLNYKSGKKTKQKYFEDTLATKRKYADQINTCSD